jgi:hypothetical protein
MALPLQGVFLVFPDVPDSYGAPHRRGWGGQKNALRETPSLLITTCNIMI